MTFFFYKTADYRLDRFFDRTATADSHLDILYAKELS